jgi:hypothetical protein
MRAMQVIELLGQSLLFATAGVGMALVTMLVALGIALMYGARSWSKLWSPFRHALQLVLHVGLAIIGTASFSLLWLYVLFSDRHSILNTFLFGLLFIVTIIGVWYCYAKATPDSLATVKARAKWS